MANSLLKELFTPSMEAHDDAEAQVGYGIDSMEHATVEVMEAYDSVVSAEQAAEELENIYIGLESIHASLEASLEDGGLDPVAAQFAHHAVEAHISRVGLEAKDTLPSLEAFGGDTGRQTSTTVSMEATEGTMSKIFEAIRRAIEAIIKTVTDFFSKLFGNAEKLEKAVVAASKKVKDAKGSPKGKMRVPNAETIAFKGSVAPGDVAKGIAETTKAFDVMTSDYLPAASKGQEDIVQMLSDNMLSDESALSKVLSQINDVETTTGKTAAKAEGELSGGRSIVVSSESDDESTTAKVTFEKAKDAKKVDDNEIDTPSKNDLESILSEAKKAANSLKGAKKNVDDAVKNYRKANKVTDELNKKAKGGKLGKMWADAKSKRAVKAASKNVVQPVQGLSSHTWTVVRSSVGYVEAAVKNYSEKKDDDK